MGTILLIFILVFIFWPIIKVIVTVNRLKRNARKAYEQMFSNGAGTAPPHRDAPKERKAGWTKSPTSKPKKIGQDIGEYVKFEEIDTEFSATTHTSTDAGNTATRTDFKAEQQIVDVEWTDIP